MKQRKMARRPCYTKEILSCQILSKKNVIKDRAKLNDKAEQPTLGTDRSFVPWAHTVVPLCQAQLQPIRERLL